MQFTTFKSAAVFAVMASAAIASAIPATLSPRDDENVCIEQNHAERRFIIKSPTFNDCDGYYDNLRGQMECSGFGADDYACGPGDGDDEKYAMVISVYVPAGCNGGSMNAVWWKASKNKEGSLSC